MIRKFKWLDKLKSQRGLAMGLAILIMFVVAILSAALYFYSSNDFLQYLFNKDLKKAQYLARTGVEVTIKAWQAVTDDTASEKETMPVYMLKDGTFYTPSEGEKAPNNSVGYYTVKVTPNVEKNIAGKTAKVVYFESTAVVGKATAKARAYTVMSLNAYDQGWYNASGTPSENGMIAIDSKVVHSSLWWGVSSTTIKGHVFPGNISFPQPNGGSNVTFSLNANQKIAYAGKGLYFDMPISLRKGTNSKNVLVLSGGDIVLNGDVELYAYYGIFNAGIGTLVLSVLEDYEYDDPVTAESYKCGKVYFGGDVYITIGRPFGSTRTKLFSKGDVYYFRGSGGLDLVKYYIDNNGTGSFIANILSAIYPSNGPKYDISYMRKIDPEKNPKDKPEDLIPPPRDEEGTVIWE